MSTITMNSLHAGREGPRNIFKALRYITNPEKTHPLVRDLDIYLDRIQGRGIEPEREYIRDDEDAKTYDLSDNVLVDAFNTSIDFKAAAEDFTFWRNQIFQCNHMSSLMGKSVIQTFTEPGMDAYTAHEIGLKLVKKVYGTRCMAVVATHCNTRFIHNHIIVSRYTLDGVKTEHPDIPDASFIGLTEIGNMLLRSYGITPDGRSYVLHVQHRIPIYKWKNKKTDVYPDTYFGYLLRDIDYCIKVSDNMGEFRENLRYLGYMVRDGPDRMYVTFFKKNGKKITFSICETYYVKESKYSLGPGYNSEEIIWRISKDRYCMNDTDDTVVVPVCNEFKYLYTRISDEAHVFYAMHRNEKDDIKIGDDEDLEIFLKTYATLISADRKSGDDVRWIPPPVRKFTAVRKTEMIRDMLKLFDGNCSIKTFGDLRKFVKDLRENLERVQRVRKMLKTKYNRGRLYDDEIEKAEAVLNEEKYVSMRMYRLLRPMEDILRHKDELARAMMTGIEMCEKLERVLDNRLRERDEIENGTVEICHDHLSGRIRRMRDKNEKSREDMELDSVGIVVKDDELREYEERTFEEVREDEEYGKYSDFER